MSQRVPKMVKILVKFYAWLCRKFRKVKISDNKVYDLPANEFSNIINLLEYKSDPLGGFIDYVADPDKFFDSKRKFGRDCDDWARQWSIWGYHNGYIAEEYFVYNPCRLFSSAHVVTLLWKNGECYLGNYRLTGPFKTMEEAFDSLKIYNKYKKHFDYIFSVRIAKE